jgi:hypothetical protein
MEEAAIARPHAVHCDGCILYLRGIGDGGRSAGSSGRDGIVPSGKWKSSALMEMARFSIFSEPERVTARDVIVSAIASSSFLLFAPAGIFEGMNADWSLYLATFFFGPLVGWISAAMYHKKNLRGIDPFYIRGWWGFSSGIITLPLCLLFRRAALDFSILLTLVGFLEIVGNWLYRKFKGISY